MAKVGYIRVSTVEQNEDRQKEAMKTLGLDKIFMENSGRLIFFEKAYKS